MTARLRTLLDDLYALDPSLRAHEEQLIPLIETLLKAKPDAEPDPAFVEQLRALLRERYEQPQRRSVGDRLAAFFTLPYLGMGLGGAVAGVLLAVAILPLPQPGTVSLPPESGDDAAPLLSFSIRRTEPRAFGDLAEKNVQGGGAVPPGLGGFGRGGGGGDGETTATMDAGLMPAPDARLLPVFPSYRFRIDGELPELPQGTVDVLKREQNSWRGNASAILSQLRLGAVDFPPLEGLAVESMNLVQDVPFGFTINIAMREGMISLYQNWQRWPQTDQPRQRQPADVPPDDQMIAIADAFVKRHGIRMDAYGEPVVENWWRPQYERLSAAERSTFSVGDVVRVVYPFLADGKPVVDSMGAPSGLAVGVNIPHRRVQEVWGIMDRTYAASAYPAVETRAEVEALLANADRMPAEILPMAAEGDRPEIVIGLGTPTIGLAIVSVFRDNGVEDLLVPSLLFPVTDVPEEAHYNRSTVIVPLAKGLEAMGM